MGGGREGGGEGGERDGGEGRGGEGEGDKERVRETVTARGEGGEGAPICTASNKLHLRVRHITVVCMCVCARVTYHDPPHVQVSHLVILHEEAEHGRIVDDISGPVAAVAAAVQNLVVVSACHRAPERLGSRLEV